MEKIVGLCEDLKKFTAFSTSELNHRGKLFGIVQPVLFWQQTNNSILLVKAFLEPTLIPLSEHGLWRGGL